MNYFSKIDRPTITKLACPVSKLVSAIAGGIGAGLRGVEDLAGTAYRSIKGDVAPEQQQLLQAAQDANIPLRTTDVLPPETFIGRQAENLGDQLPVLGGKQTMHDLSGLVVESVCLD